MPRRKRAYISNETKCAAALAALLPQEVRDDLRSRRVPAETVIRLFTPDHIVLHALGGSDKWWNLTMTRRGPELKAKDARDTGRVAKTKRIDAQWSEFTRRMAKPSRPAKAKSQWASRPFPRREKK